MKRQAHTMHVRVHVKEVSLHCWCHSRQEQAAGIHIKVKLHTTTTTITATTSMYAQDMLSFPPTALERRSRNAVHSFFSLEEGNNRFLFGITTVISRLTSQLPWPRHTAIMSVTTTTLAALSTVSQLALHHENTHRH